MRLLIIGGSDAGISAALRAKQLRPETEVTVLLADSFPNYSICGLPFYISGETPNWRTLAHRTEFGDVELACNCVAECVDPAKKSVAARDGEGRTRDFSYDKLIIATGAKPLIPAIPGIENVYPLHTMANSFAVHERLRSGKIQRVVIVGIGYIGVEMADALTHRGVQVELIGRSDWVLPTVDPEIGDHIRRQLERHSIKVRTGVTIDDITKNDSELILKGGAGFTTLADLVVWAAGVRPASDLARDAGVEVGIQGAFKANRRMETNLPDVYAAGDCIETWHRILQRYTWMPLGTTAHKQGRVAGENAVGGEAEFAGAVGTQVVKVFDLAIARTGLRDADAKSAGFSPLTTHNEVYDHKQYYTGAEVLQIRVTGDAPTGKLLGAQIAGHWRAEVAKRIDVFAAALFHHMTVDEMNGLDLSYTPPLGSPWDAVQIAAQSWAAERQTNSLEGELLR
jgi:NADPH-dependent 2,4-dienoyl-CoA reductase/sulfur reductase-like enzyme